MKTFDASKKGISTVMGSLLMIVVTLLAGIFFYTFVMGQLQTATKTVDTQISIIVLENVRINSTCIVADVRNTGGQNIEIVSAYVNDEVAVLTQQVKVAASSLAEAVIEGDYTSGSSYQVKLTGMFGTLLTFNVKYE